jgi:hypothetical protein
MGKKLVLFFLLVLGGGRLGAQILTPLTHDLSFHRPLELHQQVDTLQLPFFDDFARSEGRPDPTRWRRHGGVLISHRFAADPVTINTATFDGLTGEGQPYGTATSVGPVDTLTSLPIRLNGLSPADSLYLSFYWQAGGLGDAPNFSQAGNYYLRLEFRKKNGEWATVWQQNGQGRSTSFAPVVIPVRDPEYFYRGFAFRFVSSGSRAGSRDLWHLDYVLLDQNRRRNLLLTRDVAIRFQVSPLLRRYTAMPVHQFFIRPAEELSLSVQTFVTNLNNGPAAISWRGVLRNLTTGVAADTFLRANGVVPPLEPLYRIQGEAGANLIPFSRQPLRLRHTFFLTTKETDHRYRYNDTVSRVTELSDYFAYDDGTAETGFSYNASGTTHVAYRFDLNQLDQVAAFRIFFTRTNTPGTLLNFKIWRDLDGRPVEPAIYTQEFRVPEADKQDAFIQIALAEPVPVEGVFYAGWSQPAGTSFVNVGFDLNEFVTGRLFGWTISTGWIPLQLDRGAVMFRPVMSGVVTGTSKPTVTPTLEVWPNPSAGRVQIQGDYTQVCVYNAAGQRLFCQTRQQTGHALDLGQLSQGFYLLHFTTRQGGQVRKLVIQK